MTVVIPTLDGEKYLERIFAMIAAQQFSGEIDVLVIDSGSTDRTLDIVRAHSEVRLHQIPNEEFGHGKTRNLGAQLATGQLVAFLTQDAVPLTAHWLSELTAPLDPAGLDAAAVFGKQVPRRDCPPLLKYDIQGVFDRFGSETSVVTLPAGPVSQEEHDFLSFFSDVNSATRRDFLLDVIPFRDVRYSEDMAFASDLLDAGYRKAYSPAAAVEHSNDLTLSEFAKRIFDETMSLRRLGQGRPTFSRWQQLLHTGYNVLRDTAKIIKDPDYGVGATLYWLAVNPWFQMAKWRGYRRGTVTALDDVASIEAFSLEAARVRAARS